MWLRFSRELSHNLTMPLLVYLQLAVMRRLNCVQEMRIGVQSAGQCLAVSGSS